MHGIRYSDYYSNSLFSQTSNKKRFLKISTNSFTEVKDGQGLSYVSGHEVIDIWAKVR